MANLVKKCKELQLEYHIGRAQINGDDAMYIENPNKSKSMVTDH